MSNTKELLELAARAMGIKVIESELYPGELWMVHPDDPRFLGCRWNPRANLGDCAEMCAALGIGTDWYYDDCAIRDINAVACQRISARVKRIEVEKLSDHNNDRAAAWCMAALRVAAAIGEAMK